jgi:hypothetical protein
MGDDETVKERFRTNKEIANYYDSIKNIRKTLEYSFKACQEDHTDVCCVEKIVYWSSFYKSYDDVINLVGLVRGNVQQVQKMKETFFRENKRTLKDLLVKRYIDTVRAKEIAEKKQNNNINININMSDNVLSDHLTVFYKAVVDFDIYLIYDLYIAEKNSLDQYNKMIATTSDSN